MSILHLLPEFAREHVAHLDAAFGRPRPLERPAGPDAGTPLDADVVLAGGGLSLLYAVALSRAGARVVVADRRRAAMPHREWNVSRMELAALTRAGVLDEAECEALVVRRYREGVVRWHERGEYRVRGVLDCALDASALLAALRDRAEAAGVAILDHHEIRGIGPGRGGVAVELESAEGRSTVVARVLLDGTGAASPLARNDLVCPTVGGVLAGLDGVDPEVGDILVTTGHAEEGVQPIWEGFPGRGGECAVYYFYYSEPGRLPERPLQALYARFFERLPSYRPGAARLLRPTYGYIPGRSRLARAPASPMDRVLLVGDAAARHSPLTYCGFGSAVRSFAGVSARLMERIRDDRLSRGDLETVWTEPPSLAAQGALALMMVERGGLDLGRHPDRVNDLLDVAFGALAARGEEALARFLRDEATPGEVMGFLRETARRRPWVWSLGPRNLGPGRSLHWLWNLARMSAGGVGQGR